MGRMRLRQEIRWRTAATDPGHGRLINAVGTSLALAMSTGWAWIVVHFWHGEGALLAIGAFLAMQVGLVAKDPTPKERLGTIVLTIIPISAAVTIATLLSSWRPVEIVVFVLIAGIATWLRRFGPRATALGSVSFFGYFFAIFLRPTLADLPFFFLVAAGAVGSQTIVHALMLRERPRRQITLALAEFRSASEAAVAAAIAGHGGGHTAKHAQKALHARLARLAQVALAISSWQQRFVTARHIDCDADTLDALVLDARIDIEHACLEIAQLLRQSADPTSARRALAPSLHDLGIVLDNRSNPQSVSEAAARATVALSDLDPTSSERAALSLIMRSTLAHDALRKIDLTRGSTVAATTPVSKQTKSRVTSPALRAQPEWWEWRKWQPSTRIAAQVMVAALLATVVGELISASRWYWAVLTAFLVFVGTTTRAGILTRAYRRVWGTALGLLVGFPIVALGHDNKILLTALCVLALFSVLYFGPLQYGLMAFSLTVMLFGMYGLLGIFNLKLAELRLAETLSGALIGVLCSFLVFSLNSRPALLSKVDDYVAALKHLLDASRTALTSSHQDAAVLTAVHELDRAQSAVDQLASSMIMSFVRIGIDRANRTVHRMFVTTRAAGQLAQAAVAASTADPPQLFTGDSVTALDTALAYIRTNLSRARAAIGPEKNDAADNDQDASNPSSAPGADSEADAADNQPTVIIDLLSTLPYRSQSPQASAMMALSRLGWILLQIADPNDQSADDPLAAR